MTNRGFVKLPLLHKRPALALEHNNDSLDSIGLVYAYHYH